MKVLNGVNLKHKISDTYGGVNATVIALPIARAFGITPGATIIKKTIKRDYSLTLAKR